MTDHDIETLKLLQQWHAGDGGALDALLARDLPWIREHVRRRLGDRLRRKAETDDFVQEAVLEMLRYGPRFVVQSRAQFRTLLATIAENVLRGQHHWFERRRRAISRERPLPDDSVLQLDPTARSVSSPSEGAARHERQAWIRLGIELLPPADREVVLRREWDQMSFAEIGAEVGTSEDATRMRFQRALARLARIAKQLRNGQLDSVLEQNLQD